MLVRSFSLLLCIEIGFFPFVLPPCEDLVVSFMQPKLKKQDHPCLYPSLKWSHPIMEAKTTIVGKLLSK